MHAIRPRITTRARESRARSKLLAVLVAGAVGVALAIAAQPASAHGVSTYATEGYDYAWVSPDHRKVWVVDRECDGALVYADVVQADGRWDKVTAPSCESNWGASDTYDVYPSFITWFRVCERADWGAGAVRCGAWKQP